MRSILKDLTLTAVVALLVLCVVESAPATLHYLVNHDLVSDSDAEYIGEIIK